MDFGPSITAIPAIVIFVYLIIEVLKIVVTSKTDNYKRFIPIIAGVLGMILGIICYLFFPTTITAADNLFSAAALGIFSGLTATGANQIIKQMLKDSNNSSQ